MSKTLGLAPIEGNTARIASSPAKPSRNMPQPVSTTSAATNSQVQSSALSSTVCTNCRNLSLLVTGTSTTTAPVVVQQRARQQPYQELHSACLSLWQNCKVPRSVEELNRKAPETRRIGGSCAACTQRRPHRHPCPVFENRPERPWHLHPGGSGGRMYVLTRETLCQ